MERNISDWQDWFRINSEEHLIHSNPYNAWQDIDNAFSKFHQLPEQIKLYYSKLTPTNQKNFRLGLVEALLTLSHDKSYVPIFTLLLNIANEVNCLEILDSQFFEKILMRSKIAFLPESGRVCRKAEDIYLTSLVLLRNLAGYRNGREVAKICAEIAKSKYFPRKHKNLLFLIMIKARPVDLVNNWEKVRHVYVGDAINASQPLNNLPVFCNEFRLLISIDELGRFIKQIVCNEDFHDIDMWLLRVLLSNKKAGLKKDGSYKDIKIFYSDEPLVCETLIPTSSDLSRSGLVRQLNTKRLELHNGSVDKSEIDSVSAYFNSEFEDIIIEGADYDNHGIEQKFAPNIIQIYGKVDSCHDLLGA